MNYARIVDDVAVDVSPDPAAHFHPDIAAQFAEVPDAVEPQWRLIDGNWQAQTVIAALEARYRKQLSRVEFKMLFTTAEYVAIQTARKYVGTDPAQQQLAAALDFFFDILDDPALTVVDLTLPFVIDGVNAVVAAGLLTQVRGAAILAGWAA